MEIIKCKGESLLLLSRPTPSVLYRIWRTRNDGYEEFDRLGYNAVQWKSTEVSEEYVASLAAGLIPNFNKFTPLPWRWRNKYLRNDVWLSKGYAEWYPSTQNSSSVLLP
jgi:hypothetical protein